MSFGARSRQANACGRSRLDGRGRSGEGAGRTNGPSRGPGPLALVYADRDAGVRRRAFDRRRLRWGAARRGRGRDAPKRRTPVAPSPQGERDAFWSESSGGASSWWVGSMERVTVPRPSCQPNHWQGMAATCVETIRLGSDSIRTNCTHPDRGPARIARKQRISLIAERQRILWRSRPCLNAAMHERSGPPNRASIPRNKRTGKT